MTEGTATPRWVDRVLTINGWVVFLFLYLPILVLVAYSFSGSSTVGIWGGFSLEWYSQMFANEALMDSLRNSLVVALISTVVATVLGTAAGLAIDRYRRWIGRRSFDALLYLQNYSQMECSEERYFLRTFENAVNLTGYG